MAKGKLENTEMDMVLSPVSGNEFIIYGLGRYMMETIRFIREDNKDKILYSGLKFRKER